MKRLNGWQRIGIVLSIVWAIGIGAYEISVINGRYYATFAATYQPTFDLCKKVQDQDDESGRTNNRNCVEEAYRAALSSTPKESNWNAALVALVPIPFFWLIAYGLIALVRWVRRGFSPS